MIYIYDKIGFVHLESNHGDDIMVVNAARVSFGKRITEIQPGDRNERLLRFLIRNQHISPFQHPTITFHIKMPIFLVRQWYRHSVGFTRNELSRRYVTDDIEIWYPKTLREASKNIKQGSLLSEIENKDECFEIIKFHNESIKKTYSILCNNFNLAPELSRAILPQATYTEFIETASLAAYARLYKLRIHSTAQNDLIPYLEIINEILGRLYPLSWNLLITA